MIECDCPQPMVREQHDPYTGTHVILHLCCIAKVLVDLGHDHVREVTTTPTITWDEGQDAKVAQAEALRAKHDFVAAAKGLAVANDALGPKPEPLVRREPPQGMKDRMPADSWLRSKRD